MHMYSPTRLASQYWWMMLIWGCVIALFGLCAIFWPHLTLLTLIFLFGAFALVNGVLGIAMAVQARHAFPSWWMTLISGIVSLLIGLAVMFWPRATALVILYMIATWAMITGAFQLAEALSGTVRHSPVLLIIAGLASLLLGVILFASSPIVALLALVWVIGLYALVTGCMFIIRSFHFRSLLKSEQGQHQREPEFLP